MATAAEIKKAAGNSTATASDIKAAASMKSPVKEFFGQLSRTTNQAMDPEGYGAEQGPNMPPFIEPSENPPTTTAGQAGNYTGMGMMMAPALGTGAGFVRPAAEGAKRVPAFFQNLFSNLGKTYKAAPVATTAAETIASGAAGAGGFLAAEKFPDSEYAQLAGELVGGTLPSIMPSTLAIRGTNFLRNRYSTFRRGRDRAVERIDRAVPEDARQAAVDSLDAPTTIDPETGRPVLSLAQRTDDGGLLALEKDIMESTDQLSRASDEQIARANEVIQQSSADIGGPIDSTIETIEAAQSQLQDLLNTRLRIATRQADERLEQMGPNVTREQANRVASEELEKVVQAGRKQEDELYSVIPENTAVPYSQTRGAYRRLMAGLGKAQKKDMPDVATQLLDPESADYLGNLGYVGLKKGETTIKELRALQSKLREIARNNRAGDAPNYNAARIADDLANTIVDDLADAAAPGAADDLKIAVGFSRDFNQRISRGTVGKLLGRTRSGGDAVPSGLTLEQSVGFSGPKAREAFDDIIKAFDSPEAPSSQTVIGATQDYLKNKFIKAAEKGLDSPAVRRFVNSNEELLTRMPDLRRQIDEAIDSGSLQKMRQAQKDRVSFTNPNISKATMLIQRGPEQAFQEISKLRPIQAAQEVKKLINLVKRDKSGEAMEGLKSGFVSFLMNGAKQGKRDVKGVNFMSGYELRDMMNNPSIKDVMSRVLTVAERERMKTIQSDLVRLERRRQASQSKEGVLGDIAGKVVQSLAGVAGARISATVTRATGGPATVQIPGIMAARFRDMTKMGIEDPARRLIADSVSDERLFRELLQASTKDGELSPRATARFRTWVATVLAQEGLEDEETE